MKQLYTKPKFKNYNNQRSNNRSRRASIYKEWLRVKNKLNNGRSIEEKKLHNTLVRNPLRKVIAPENICLKTSTNDFVNFINKIRDLYIARKSTHIDFSKVKFIDKDSIVVVIASLVQLIAGKIILIITKPKDDDIHKILVHSGFYKKLNDKYIEARQYRFRLNNNTETVSYRNVEYSIAEQIVFDSSKYVWGEPRRCPGLYKILIELMHNTHNHANKEAKGKQNWWLSIMGDKDKKVVRFSFVDFGLGIIRNLDNKKSGEKFYNWRKILQELVMTKIKTPNGRDIFLFGFLYSAYEPEYLRLLLEGSLHKEEKKQKANSRKEMRRTSTNLYYRGKGLPTLKQTLDRNHIKNLFAITNNVRADITGNDYDYINGDFSGTFFCWELDAECFNLPYNIEDNDEHEA